MAHEELKALYEIDRQHSDTPWEFWEFHDGEEWLSAGIYPMFNARVKYRRKPDAPAWPDDKEDARKWRELEKKVNRYGSISAATFNDIRHGKTKLIQGHTAEQWQTIIDGKFLCEFADYNFPKSPIISALHSRKDSGFCCEDEDGEEGVVFKNCRPLRIKGVRQPWFGGECPVSEHARVSYVLRDGYKEQTEAGRIRWTNKGIMSDIVEFIEL